MIKLLKPPVSKSAIKKDKIPPTEPLPLFEWSVFRFFWGGPKETRHRSAETLLPDKNET